MQFNGLFRKCAFRTSNAGGLLTRMRPKTEPVVCKRLEIPKTEDELDYMLFEINVMKTHGHHPVRDRHPHPERSVLVPAFWFQSPTTGLFIHFSNAQLGLSNRSACSKKLSSASMGTGVIEQCQDARDLHPRLKFVFRTSLGAWKCTTQRASSRQ